MALVRILVDGYSLLHNWPELAPGKPWHSAAARDELVHIPTQYRDATSTPFTTFFDGAGAPPGTSKTESTPDLEVLFSRAGQTADEMIERAAHRFGAYGEVLAVTDDQTERDVVSGLGGFPSGCLDFIQMVENTLVEAGDELRNHNRQERSRFNRQY